MRVRRWGVVLASATACLLLSSCELPRFGLPRGATSQSKSTLHLWQGSVIAALCVGAAVWALIFYVVLRYRRRSDELPSQKQYNVPWEVAYTAIPVVIVAVLFGFTVGAQNRVDHLSANPAVSVQITGYQWGWRFEYAGTGVSIASQGNQAPILVVPSGQAVRVVLVSADVVHGFYVPDFLFKRDAVPGFTNRFDLNVQHPGTYGGRCTVFCGLRHDRMLFTVQAMAPPDFAAWLARQRSAS